MDRIALIGSWDPLWVKDHKNWLEKHGEHRDGWTNHIKEEHRARLAWELENRGYFNFYAYQAKRWDGDGTVQCRFRVIGFEYYDPPILFRHAHGSHKTYPEEHPARAVFMFAKIQASPRRELRYFRTVAGRTVKPMTLLSLPCVLDPG